MRNYSLTENPFVDGLKHEGYKVSNNFCGVAGLDEPQPYNRIESSAYWAGRGVRFLGSSLAAITFLFLQSLAVFCLTAEVLAIKITKSNQIIII